MNVLSGFPAQRSVVAAGTSRQKSRAKKMTSRHREAMPRSFFCNVILEPTVRLELTTC
jgi:hypothetical protein